MIYGMAGYVGGPSPGDQAAKVEGGLGVALGSGHGEGSLRGSRSDLAAGHPIDVVVGADNRHLQVATGGMDEVIPPDGGQIAIAADDHHL
jgi:hypothetical protein